MGRAKYVNEINGTKKSTVQKEKRTFGLNKES